MSNETSTLRPIGTIHEIEDGIFVYTELNDTSSLGAATLRPIDIEKLAKDSGDYVKTEYGTYEFTFEELKQFAEAYAAKVHDKRVEELEREIDEIKEDGDKWLNESLRAYRENVELQAHINDLREALEDIAKHTPENFWQNKAAQQALSKTPAQSLQAFENEVIERCAVRGRLAQLENKVVDIEIRALKDQL